MIARHPHQGTCIRRYAYDIRKGRAGYREWSVGKREVIAIASLEWTLCAYLQQAGHGLDKIDGFNR